MVNFLDYGPAGRGIVYKSNSYCFSAVSGMEPGMEPFEPWHKVGGLGYMLWPPSGDPKGGFTEIWPSPLTLGEWKHAALVYNKETGEATLYLNGERIRGPSYFGPSIKNSSENLKVAKGCWGSNFEGAIDEVRISDIVRYSGSTYAVPTSPFTCDQHTRALWHFDEP